MTVPPHPIPPQKNSPEDSGVSVVPLESSWLREREREYFFPSFNLLNLVTLGYNQISQLIR